MQKVCHRQFPPSVSLLDYKPFLTSPRLQGDFPWDEKDFRYMAVTAAGLGSVLLYLYFRDVGREISWKEFVQRYLGRGLVRISVVNY